jgi:TrpR-related protein YerC/YecD
MVKQRKGVQNEFRKLETFEPRNAQEQALITAFASIEDTKLMGSFMRDLMTPAEIEEFSNRLEIARLLTEGHSYQEVADKTKVSTTTVTRVAHWLFNGCGGYHAVLIKNKK